PGPGTGNGRSSLRSRCSGAPRTASRIRAWFGVDAAGEIPERPQVALQRLHEGIRGAGRPTEHEPWTAGGQRHDPGVTPRPSRVLGSRYGAKPISATNRLPTVRAPCDGVVAREDPRVRAAAGGRGG